MSEWTFYAPESGLFVGRAFSGPREDLAANTPSGLKAIEGRFDHLSQRVDFATGKVVDYQPPAPPDTEFEVFEWNAEVKRWLSKPTTAAIARAVRQERDRRLSECDWVVAKAVETGGVVPDAWAAYRAALRDLTGQLGFPENVTWPTKP